MAASSNVTVYDPERGRVYNRDTGEIMTTTAGARDAAREFRMLDVYESGQPLEEKAPWLGTISAGFKNDKGYPQASRDGTIYASGNCPNLQEILKANGGKKLTIALLSNDLTELIHQHYVLYSATRLLAHGDMFEMVVYEELDRKTPKGESIYVRQVYGADTHPEEYAAWRARCKAAWDMFFTVAVWKEDVTASIEFPDGVGQYRLRSTSRHSRASVQNKLRLIQRITGGQIAGIPLDLTLQYYDVADGQGTRRNIPVWDVALQPPGGVRLASGNFGGILGAAVEEMRKMRVLALPAPATAEDYERAEARDVGAILEPIVAVEPTAAELAAVSTPGAPCNPRDVQAAWFATVDGSFLDSEAARSTFIAKHTHTRTASLAEFCETATVEEAEALITAARHAVLERERTEAPETQTGPIVAPPATPIDAPVINTAPADIAPPAEPPAPPKPPSPAPRREAPAAAGADALTRKREDLNLEWGKLWNRGKNVGIKDFTVTSKLTDAELRQAIDELRPRVEIAERESGTVELSDLDENGGNRAPALPLDV